MADVLPGLTGENSLSARVSSGKGSLAAKLTNVLELSAVTGHKSLQVLKRYYNPHAGDLAKKLGWAAVRECEDG